MPLVMNCQIEHGASDSDVGTPCSNQAVATLTVEWRSVQTVACGVVGNRSASGVAITTRLIPACGNQFRTNPIFIRVELARAESRHLTNRLSASVLSGFLD
jgi:hypothetical protein